MPGFLISLIAVAVLALSAGSASATPVLFTGTGTGSSGVTLNASANFAISGNVLTITLRNAGDTSGTASNSDKPENTLTGLFFDLPTGISLSPVSATIAAGALVQASSCNTGPCSASTTNVGGEFVYDTGTWSGHSGNSGIASSGYIDPGGATFFGGPSLDTPSPNGINFGIISDMTATNKFKPNGGLSGRPLIEEQVVFTLNIAGGTLTEQQISNVSFQYGTGLGEPYFGGSSGSGGSGGAGQGVPEPGMLLLLGPAAVALARRTLRREKSRRFSL